MTRLVHLLLTSFAAFGRWFCATLGWLTAKAVHLMLTPFAAFGRGYCATLDWLTAKLGPHFEMKTEQQRQRGLSMIEIMLGLTMIAIVTAAGVTAYNNVAPRVRVNNLMASMQPALIDMAQFNQLHYTPDPLGTGMGTPSSAASALGVAASTVTRTCASLSGTANYCTSLGCGVPGTPPGACTGGGNVVDPNITRLANAPSIRRDDGGYDADATEEWHIPIGANDAIEMAFLIAPGLGATAVAGIADTTFVTNCGLAVDQSMWFAFTTEDGAVCENFAIAIDRLEHITSAWCDETTVVPAAAEGEALIGGCMAAP